MVALARSPRAIRRTFGAALAAAVLLAPATPRASADEAKPDDPLIEILSAELERSLSALRAQADPAPYFGLYQVKECRKTSLGAANGSLRRESTERHRHLGVQVRVGDWQVDDTHPLRQERPDFSFGDRGAGYLPLGDDPDAIRTVLWLETDRVYRKAAERFIKVRTNRAVTVDEEDPSADFTPAEPVRHLARLETQGLDRSLWEGVLEEASRVFLDYPGILRSEVRIDANDSVKYLVTSEGTALRQPAASFDLFIRAQAKAADGMELERSESFERRSAAGLPDRGAVLAAARTVAEEVAALARAPVVEPYSGPAILSGRAAAVFFHEVFGHRLEGHRQKDEGDGQTFTKKLGQAVLPEFVSVHDDPTLGSYGGTELNGHYRYDDEGVAAERVTLVENGVLRRFLLSRSPIAGFERSNGHGRGATGRQPVARQGNLIVEATSRLDEGQLRARLVEELHRQGKPFGLYFKDITGGRTQTGRWSAQAYLVYPVMVYRVFADGRPDELVRGVNLVGTPLSALSEIIAFGSEIGVFSGSCGAESGWIGVSAVAPSFLTGKVEVQKKEKSADPPPLLPPPAQEAGR